MSRETDTPGIGHNAPIDNVTRKHLRALTARIQTLDAEISALNADKSEVYREAKNLGFDPNGLRAAIRWMRDPAASIERDTITKLYVDALETPPAGDADEAVDSASRARARARARGGAA
jgi:uncharacterized protein (UPF0335 family)